MPFFILPVIGFVARFFVSRAIVSSVAPRFGLGLVSRTVARVSIMTGIRRVFRAIRAEESSVKIALDVTQVAVDTVGSGLRTHIIFFGVKRFVRSLHVYEHGLFGNTILTDINRALVFKTMRGTVQRTPVDTGFARASWFAERNDGSQPKGSDLTQFSAGGAAATARAMQSVDRVNFEAHGIYWVTNNVPYIESLEFGLYGDGPKTTGGFSRQAPQGMVRVTLAEINAELDNEMRKIIRIEERRIQRQIGRLN